ncbi:uncharacterized protein LOC130368872 isoform X2 [Hyla sarda]|uniref:uncharacterized protein LOC130368872 isoform X2 n=1 Tax=Hyla sarda TaxID=327740 RepID=UPI0024C25E57|nr:uncharacterized protein LOC130368872 isoform X2 [Hyla sarda]
MDGHRFNSTGNGKNFPYRLIERSDRTRSRVPLTAATSCAPARGWREVQRRTVSEGEAAPSTSSTERNRGGRSSYFQHNTWRRKEQPPALLTSAPVGTSPGTAMVSGARWIVSPTEEATLSFMPGHRDTAQYRVSAPAAATNRRTRRAAPAGDIFSFTLEIFPCRSQKNLKNSENMLFFFFNNCSFHMTTFNFLTCALGTVTFNHQIANTEKCCS